MTTIERMAVKFAADSTEPNRIRGRAVPYNVPDGRPGWAMRIGGDGRPEIVDYGNSVFDPGAFSSWLASNSGRVAFLFQHGDAGESWSDTPLGVNALPIGTITAFSDAPDGLYFTAEFASHPLAQAVRELAASGALSELSFAMRPVSVEFRDALGGVNRHVTEGELWDVSVVVWGQFGASAAITEVFSTVANREANRAVETTVKAAHELSEAVRYAGASISKANADVLNAAVTDIRSSISKLSDHADAIEEMVASGTSQSSDANGGDAEQQASSAIRLTELRLREAEASI